MTSPASIPPRIRPLWLLIGWVVAVAGIYGGVYGFSSESLQNNSEFLRRDLWISIPDLLSEHLSPTINPNLPEPPPSGWQYFSERLRPLAVAAAILLFAWGWGHLVVRLLFDRDGIPDRLERAYWSLCLGLAIWGTLTLLVGLCGCLSLPVFSALGGMPLLVAVVRYGMEKGTDKTVCATNTGRTVLGRICVFAIAPFLLAMLLGSLQPPNDFDVKEYHLGGAKEFFLRGRVEMLPHDVYTSFPFLTEMLCLSGMVLKRDWWAGALAGQAVLAAFAPITALGLFVAARRWLGSTAGWFAVLVHLTCPWIYRISIIAYAEGGLACFLFATFFAAMRAIEADDGKATRRWTLLTGLLAGASAGCKYPAALTVVIPLGILLLSGRWWTARPSSHPSFYLPLTARLSPLFRLGLLYSTGVLLTFGPWLGKNLCETGNPVYPLLYSVFGGQDWDEASNAKWKAGHPLPLKDITGPSWVVRDTRDRLWDVFLESDWQSALYLSLAVAVVFAIWRSRHAKAQELPPLGLLLLAVAYSLWLFFTWQFFTHRIDRFWVPMLPVLSLLAGAGLSSLWETAEQVLPGRSRHVYWVLRGFIAAPVFAVVVFNLALATSPLGGNNSYLMRMEDLKKVTRTPCVKYVDQLQLGSTDKVLFVGEAELFDAEFPYEYNTVFDHSIFEQDCSLALPDVPAGQQPLRPAAAILDRWRSRGITHVVVNWSEILRYRTTYTYTDFAHPSRFQALVDAGALVSGGPPERTLLSEMSPEKQAEVQRWAPELVQPGTPDEKAVILFEVYRVVR